VADVDAGIEAESGTGFHVHLEVFEGPFDLLLSLIARKQLDVTLVALAQVTDEFLVHIRAHGNDWDLDQASSFLVVAATLLDLKVARLLPSAEIQDEEDLALLEARDLLFARLLQYRAFKQLAAIFAERMAAEGTRHPRQVPMEPAFTALLPEVLLGVDPRRFAEIAARAMTPKPVPVVELGHLHAPKVSVREQAVLLAERLRSAGAATFRSLTTDSETTLVVVARFLALLELSRWGSCTSGGWAVTTLTRSSPVGRPRTASETSTTPSTRRRTRERRRPAAPACGAGGRAARGGRTRRGGDARPGGGTSHRGGRPRAARPRP
jgi:segregation and condensation protein A